MAGPSWGTGQPPAPRLSHGSQDRPQPGLPHNALPQTLYPRDRHLVLGVSHRDLGSPLPFLSLYLTDVSAHGACSQKSLSLPHPASSHPTSDLSPNLLSSPLKYTQILTSSHLPSCRPHLATPISQRKYHTECLCLPAPAHNTSSPPQPGGSFKKRESVGNGAATLANSLTAPPKDYRRVTTRVSTQETQQVCPHRNVCMKFPAVHTVAQRGERLECPSAAGGIKKLCTMPAVQHYPARERSGVPAHTTT